MPKGGFCMLMCCAVRAIGACRLWLVVAWLWAGVVSTGCSGNSHQTRVSVTFGQKQPACGLHMTLARAV